MKCQEKGILLNIEQKLFIALLKFEKHFQILNAVKLLTTTNLVSLICEFLNNRLSRLSICLWCKNMFHNIRIKIVM